MYDSPSETILRPVQRKRRVRASAVRLWLYPASIDTHFESQARHDVHGQQLWWRESPDEEGASLSAGCHQRRIAEGQPHLLEEQLGSVRQRDLDDVLRAVAERAPSGRAAQEVSAVSYDEMKDEKAHPL
jgi:hypothetical protein